MSTTATRIGGGRYTLRRPMRRLVAATVLAATAVLAPSALGAGAITPISPKQGDTVPAGKRPTFKLRYRGKGPIYVHVCKSAKKSAKGLICNRESIGKARKKSGSRAVYRARLFDFPEFWLNQPGTYYWQAHRIVCEDGIGDCRIEGPIVKFKVG
jgi:hypothetical protein